MPADLHIHTSFSDGYLTPEHVVQLAKQIGLNTIAITDHDTVGGVSPAIIAGKAHGIDVIPAVELNTKLDSLEVHILGYYVDHNSLELHQALAASRETRMRRAQMMIEKLNALNIDIEYEAVERLAGHSALGRPHIARVLCEHGYADSVQEAFNRYLKVGAPAYVGLIKWNPFEAIDIIKKAGGIAVLAHPGSYKADHLLPELIARGLRGIEVYCLKHSPGQTEHYRELAESNGLLITGGSDFHNAVDAIYDAILGSVPLNDEHVEKLRLEHTNGGPRK